MGKIHIAYDDTQYTPGESDVFVVVNAGTGLVRPVPSGDVGGGGGGGGATTLDDLTDVTITTPATGDLLRYNGTDWVNYPDSNYAVSGHVHDAGDVTTGTFVDARISQTSVTQHQAALTITESQISDLSHYTTTSFNTDFSGKVLNDISDVVITTPADNEVLAFNSASGEWINQTAAEAGLSTVGHSHVEADITNLDHYTSTDFTTDFGAKSTTDLSEGTNLYYTTTRVNSDIDTRVTKSFVDALNVDADTLDGIDSTGFATSGHSHAINALSDVVITTPADNEVLAFNSASGEWINQTAAEAGLATAVHSHAASDVTSGTFVDARISASSVQQHITKAYIDGLNVDADTLDGIDSTGFATSGHNHDATYINVSGDTMTGDLIFATDLIGVILKASNGTQYRVTVDNTGNLTTTAVV